MHLIPGNKPSRIRATTILIRHSIVKIRNLDGHSQRIRYSGFILLLLLMHGPAAGVVAAAAAALIGRPHPPRAPIPAASTFPLVGGIIVGGSAGTAAHEFWLQLQPDVSRSWRMTSQWDAEPRTN